MGAVSHEAVGERDMAPIHRPILPYCVRTNGARLGRHEQLWQKTKINLFSSSYYTSPNVYVPPCIHLFPHARADTIQVLEHEHNFSKFDQLTISFLVP